MIVDLFRALIIAQPFLWIWIIEDDRWEFLNDVNIDLWFGVLVFVWSVLIFIFDISIAFYSTELLILYSWMVWGSVYVLINNHKYNFRKAIANSFLIVYLNSWYWESFLHIWNILENGLNMNQVLQILHLIPAIYFLVQYRFDVSEAIHRLWNGFMFSTIIYILRRLINGFQFWATLDFKKAQIILDFINHGLMISNRLICLFFLFNVIIVWGMHKSDYLKLMRQTQILYT